MPLITGDLNRRALRRIIVENFIETSLGFGEFGGTCSEKNGAAWYRTGLAHPFLNGVIGARITASDPGRIIRECIEIISANDTPHAWVVGPDDSPTNLSELLEKAGLNFAFELRGMAMDLSKLTSDPSLHNGLVIKEVEIGETFDDLMDVEHVTLSNNEVLTGFLRSYYGQLLQDGNRRWRHFIGYAGDKAVACSSMLLNGEIAGIYNVGTLESFRKRGFGSALTTLPLLKARQEGYRWAVLHSSPLGLPVYTRIGFEDICPIRIFLPAGAIEAGN